MSDWFFKLQGEMFPCSGFSEGLLVRDPLLADVYPSSSDFDLSCD